MLLFSHFDGSELKENFSIFNVSLKRNISSVVQVPFIQYHKTIRAS